MNAKGKYNLLGVLIDATDYDTAVSRILDAAKRRVGFSVAAVAVHGVTIGARDKVHRYRLNRIDLVTPDGQPVRWALNWLYGLTLQDRVYGPELMLRVCAAAAQEGLPIFLYGSAPVVVERLRERLLDRFPRLMISGSEPSKFRRLTHEEKIATVSRIRQSGARLVFVGLGCPLQEVFVYEYRDALEMPVIAVGAAFLYHAGFLREPPRYIQRAGLQWLHRLAQEPRRLWRRYVILNTQFVLLFLCQLTRLIASTPEDAQRPAREERYG